VLVKGQGRIEREVKKLELCLELFDTILLGRNVSGDDDDTCTSTESQCNHNIDRTAKHICWDRPNFTNLTAAYPHSIITAHAV